MRPGLLELSKSFLDAFGLHTPGEQPIEVDVLMSEVNASYPKPNPNPNPNTSPIPSPNPNPKPKRDPNPNSDPDFDPNPKAIIDPHSNPAPQVNADLRQMAMGAPTIPEGTSSF